MIGVNLMPARKVEARRRTRRIRAWVIACAGYSLLMVGVGAFAAAGASETESLRAKISEATLRLDTAHRGATAGKLALSVKSRRLEAAKAVSGHPDWSVLLDLLARHIGDDVVLERISLRSDTQRSGPRLPGAGAPASRYIVMVDGVATTQAGVSRYAMALEQAGVFDLVRPEQTQSRKVGTLDAVSFELRCELSDAGAARAGGGQ